MSTVLNTQNDLAIDSADQPCLIVIGSGPVSVHFINQLHNRQPDIQIKVFGDEPWQPYNRVRLTTVLSGETSHEQLFTSEALPESASIQSYWNNRVNHIDPEKRQVTDSHGRKHHYTQLVLAVGSRPRIPSIPGVDLKHVYTFRNLSDAQALLGRQVSSRCTVVIGGGLLGLEAARAMQRFNTEVVCIEHSTRLMFNQIDDRGSTYLERYLNDLGIKTEVRARVKTITGDGKVEAVHLDNGKIIYCDTVIVSTGILPNIEIARSAGISVSSGIRINDRLQTNVKDIYAIGECAEHDGKIYGLVSPGFEQAAVLAKQLSDGEAYYLGTTTATQLKVVDYPVLSIGQTNDITTTDDEYVYQEPDNGIYRKLVISRNNLQSAIAIGDWSASQRIQEAVARHRFIWPWQKQRFLAEGDLWEPEEAKDVAEWPAIATVCNCMGVTRGTLSHAIQSGEDTVEKLCKATGASSVCGTCRPLLENLTQSNEPPPKVKWSAALLTSAIVAIFGALVLFLLPGFPASSSVQGTHIDILWQDSLIKQISGFTTLGLSTLILLISIRKRTKKLVWGDFTLWRAVHVVIGASLLAVLFIHTGFHLGSQLNLLLMLFFAGLIVLGAVASGVISLEHRLARTLSTRLRKVSIWTHILLFWPVPVLLGFHIFKTYYY